MRVIDIPGCDLQPSAVCLGGGPFGTEVTEEDAFVLLDAFFAAGGNFLDTALVYGDWAATERSVSEKIIGRWMRTRGVREDVIVGTKGGHPLLNRMDVPRLSPQEIISDLEASLSHLQTDCIDIYWLHRDDPGRPVGDMLETLEARVGRGCIRYYGCSNWTVSRIRQASEYARAHGLRGFIANQPMWSLARPVRECLPDATMAIMDEEGAAFHRSTGMAAIPYSAQAGGFFAKTERSGLDGLDENRRRLYGSAENEARSERAQNIAREWGTTVGSVALAFLMSQPFPVIPIIGAKDPRQLRDGLRAADLTLTAETLSYLTGPDALL